MPTFVKLSLTGSICLDLHLKYDICCSVLRHSFRTIYRKAFPQLRKHVHVHILLHILPLDNVGESLAEGLSSSSTISDIVQCVIYN